MITKDEFILMFKQVLLTSPQQNVQRLVRRICIMILGLKWLIVTKIDVKEMVK